MVEVFGDEKGQETRSAVRMASLLGNQLAENEAIFEVSAQSTTSDWRPTHKTYAYNNGLRRKQTRRVQPLRLLRLEVRPYRLHRYRLLHDRPLRLAHPLP